MTDCSVLLVISEYLESENVFNGISGCICHLATVVNEECRKS